MCSRRLKQGWIDACVACGQSRPDLRSVVSRVDKDGWSGGRQREATAGFAIRQNLNGNVSGRDFRAALPPLQDCEGQILSSHQMLRFCRGSCDDAQQELTSSPVLSGRVRSELRFVVRHSQASENGDIDEHENINTI